MITIEQYLQGRDKTYAKEYHPSVAENGKILLAKVNALLAELGIAEGEVEVASGWRPSSYNKLIGGAANSYHVKGMAIDLIDDPEKRWIGTEIENRPELLTKYGLWMESLDHTRGWVHLNIGTRQDREVRIFLP